MHILFIITILINILLISYVSFYDENLEKPIKNIIHGTFFTFNLIVLLYILYKIYFTSDMSTSNGLVDPQSSGLQQPSENTDILSTLIEQVKNNPELIKQFAKFLK